MRKTLPLFTLTAAVAACDMSPGALSGRRAGDYYADSQIVRQESDSVYQGECTNLQVETPTLKATEAGTETEACRMPRYAIQTINLQLRGHVAESYRLGLRPIPGTESQPKYAEVKRFTLRNWSTGEIAQFECKIDPTPGSDANVKFVDCNLRGNEITNPNGTVLVGKLPTLYIRKHEASGAFVAHEIQVKNPDCEATVTYTDPYASKMGSQGCYNENGGVYGSDRAIDDMSFGEVTALSESNPGN